MLWLNKRQIFQNNIANCTQLFMGRKLHSLIEVKPFYSGFIIDKCQKLQFPLIELFKFTSSKFNYLKLGEDFGSAETR